MTEFNPKPGEPGARAAWTDDNGDAHTGVVWAYGPKYRTGYRWVSVDGSQSVILLRFYKGKNKYHDVGCVENHPEWPAYYAEQARRGLDPTRPFYVYGTGPLVLRRILDARAA